jgi:hypothetical protein
VDPTTAGAPTPVTVKLWHARGTVGGYQVFDVSVVQNSAAENTTYISELYNYEEFTSDPNMYILAIIMISLSCCSCLCVYTCIWCYYKRRGHLPWFDTKNKEDEARLTLNLPK